VVESAACNYCGGEQTLVYDGIRDWEYGVRGSYAYMRCVDCGGVQLAPFPSLEDLKRSYDSDYHGYTSGEGRGRLFSILYALRARLFRSRMSRLVNSDARVLDVGCGAGDFLRDLRGLGVDRLEGIDFSPEMVDRLRLLDIRGFCGTFGDFPGEDGSYDLVAMNNYLEHTLEPRAELGKALRLLKPGACLVGEVPGFDSWERKLFGRFWGGNHAPRHTYQFDVAFLKRLLEKIGFVEVTISHQLNTSHWALSVQNYLQRNCTDLRDNPSLKHGRGSYYVFLLLLFIPLDLICVWLRKSGCTQFVARKPIRDMNTVYSSRRYAQGYPEGIEHHFWHVARNALLARALERVAGPGEKVMDIGCGPGIFLRYMQGRGLELVGVELGSPPLLPDLTVRTLTGTDAMDLDETECSTVDVLLLLDVIEHLEDREIFLKKLWRKFPNAHHVLVTVPARMELWSGYDEHWGHRLRYDRVRLAAELERAGFAPERNYYAFNWLYVVSLLVKTLGIRRRNSFASPRRNRLTSRLHGLLALMTRIETRLVPGFVPGSSLVCIARRVGRPATGSG